MKRIYSGFTLINLLTALTLVSLLATTGIPSLQALLANTQANSTYQDLFTLIQFTRIQSVNHSSQAILCPSTNQTDCVADWNQTLMVFIDNNSDETRNENEPILKVRAALVENEQLSWRASGSRRYLRFKADGTTRNQNGRLTYCLTKGENRYARQIIMYRTGRARKSGKAEAMEHCNISIS